MYINYLCLYQECSTWLNIAAAQEESSCSFEDIDSSYSKASGCAQKSGQARLQVCCNDVKTHVLCERVILWITLCKDLRCLRIRCRVWCLTSPPTETCVEALAGVPETMWLVAGWWHWGEAAGAVCCRGLESRRERWRGGRRGGDGQQWTSGG